MVEHNRPALSQSPLRMHNNKNNGGQNFSQKQLGTLPNQGAQNGNRASDFKASPIRESLIKNTGAFILGNGNNNGNNQGASGGTNPTNMISQVPSTQQLMNNFSATNTAAGNADLTNIATNQYVRDRSLERNAKDMSSNIRESQEKDVLDNFMSLPKQQQMQIQMLTEQQQMAYITQHRAETSGVKLHNNHNHFNQLNTATFRGVPPSSGGTGAAQIAFNPLHQNQQQSSQPILHTTSKYGQPVMQARQSQIPQLGKGGKHGDSGSFTLNRNNANGGLLISHTGSDPNKKNQTLSNSPNKQGETIKNKRVFIENTVDSILHSKQTKTSSFMGKPVGVMSGTGTTDVHPKVHSVSPRGNLGNSIVGLPNIVVGQGQAPGAVTNITKVNNRSGGISPANHEESKTQKAAESQAPQRAADANRQVDDFLAETDKMTFM